MNANTGNDTAEELIPRPHRNRLDEFYLDGLSVLASVPQHKCRRHGAAHELVRNLPLERGLSLEFAA